MKLPPLAVESPRSTESEHLIAHQMRCDMPAQAVSKNGARRATGGCRRGGGTHMGIGPPTSAQLQSCPCAPAASPPCVLGQANWVRPKVDSKSGTHVVQDLARHGFPQLSLGKYRTIFRQRIYLGLEYRKYTKTEGDVVNICPAILGQMLHGNGAVSVGFEEDGSSYGCTKTVGRES